jgi:class 3 adenylate cyclase
MPGDFENSVSQPLERKLATILSADVAEFSRLMSEDEEGTLRTFRGHKEVFESLVAMHRGRIFNTAGDAILAEFNSAVEAVRCATDIQTALRTRNDKLPLNRQVRFRIGINLGDVMLQGQDLLGDGVNVAARLQTAAEPGGVCISGSVHNQIRNKLSLTFQSLGEKSYKNIAQPIRTFSVLESEGGHTLPTPKPATGGGSGKWIGIAAVVLLLCGAGYWAYSIRVRNAAGNSTATASVAQPASASNANVSSNLETQPATQPTANAAAAPPPKPTAGAPAGSVPASQPAAKQSSATSSPTSAPSSAVPAPTEGDFYAGPVCFAETKREPARCTRGTGHLNGNRITGQWSMGPNSGVTMFLSGDVAETGDVKIEMHSEKPDGSRLATIDLKGTLHDGHLDATGNFRAGRAATLNWHKDVRGSHADVAK